MKMIEGSIKKNSMVILRILKLLGVFNRDITKVKNCNKNPDPMISFGKIKKKETDL